MQMFFASVKNLKASTPLAFIPPILPGELVFGVKHLRFSSWETFLKHRDQEPQRLFLAYTGARIFLVRLARSHILPGSCFALVYSTSSYLYALFCIYFDEGFFFR
jgi:hypothetical protein